jgi:hypothetical protein
VLYVPLRLVSENNLRQHWAVKAKRVTTQREMVRRVWLDRFADRAADVPDVAVGLTVTICRIAPRALDDDNNVASGKAVRDELAWQLGLPVKNEKKRIADDRDPRVAWAYGQRRGVPKEYAVEITITEGVK